MIKRISLFLACLIFTVGQAFPQDLTEESDTVFWDFGFYFAPDYNSRLASGTAENGQDAVFFNNLEDYRIGYTAGVNMTRQLGKHIYIQTGIYYQNKGYNSGAQVDTVLDLYDQYYSSAEFQSICRYNSIYIPVILRFKLFNAGKAQFNLGLGAAPDLFIAKTRLRVFDDHTERDVTKAEQVIDAKALLNLNINIALSEKVLLAFEPNFSYNILGFKDSENPGIKRNLFTAGLGLQLSFRVTDQSLYDYYYLHIYKKPPKPSW